MAYKKLKKKQQGSMLKVMDILPDLVNMQKGGKIKYRNGGKINQSVQSLLGTAAHNYLNLLNDFSVSSTNNRKSESKKQTSLINSLRGRGSNSGALMNFEKGGMIPLSSDSFKVTGASHENGGVPTLNGIPTSRDNATEELEGREIVTELPNGERFVSPTPEVDPESILLEGLQKEKGLLELRLGGKLQKTMKAFDKRMGDSKKSPDRRELNTIDFMVNNSGLSKRIEAVDSQIQDIIERQNQRANIQDEAFANQPQFRGGGMLKKLQLGGFTKDPEKNKKKGFNFFSQASQDINNQIPRVGSNLATPIDPSSGLSTLSNLGSSALSSVSGLGNIDTAIPFSGSTGRALTDSIINVNPADTASNLGQGVLSAEPQSKSNISDITNNILQKIGQGVKAVGNLGSEDKLTLLDTISAVRKGLTRFQEPSAPILQDTVSSRDVGEVFRPGIDDIDRQFATVAQSINNLGLGQGASNIAQAFDVARRGQVSNLLQGQAQAQLSEDAAVRGLNQAIQSGNVERVNQFQNQLTAFRNEQLARQDATFDQLVNIGRANELNRQQKREALGNLAANDPRSILSFAQANPSIFADSFFGGDLESANRFIANLKSQIDRSRDFGQTAISVTNDFE
jgi:hypothetical protein